MKDFKGFKKGLNLGGWISQFAKYDTKHFDTFIIEKDIKYIASLGFDHVRVPVDYIVLEDENGNPKEEGFKYLNNCLNWCKKYNLHMLVDLHECYGYSFDPLKKDMDREKFFFDKDFQKRFFKLWTRIATNFKENASIVALEPLNEVCSYNVIKEWNKIVEKYIKLIRKISPDFYIVVGGVDYNHVSCIKYLDKPADGHIVFNFHCYEPIIFTHQGAYWMEEFKSTYRLQYPLPIETYRTEHTRILGPRVSSVFNKDIVSVGPSFFESIFKEAVDIANKYQIPLYCGEYGVIDLCENKSKIAWLKDIHQAFKKYNIGSSLWNYKEKDFGLVDKSFSSIKEDFIEILKNR